MPFAGASLQLVPPYMVKELLLSRFSSWIIRKALRRIPSAFLIYGFEPEA